MTQLPIPPIPEKRDDFLSPRLLLLLLLGTKVSFGHHRPLELVCDGEEEKF